MTCYDLVGLCVSLPWVLDLRESEPSSCDLTVVVLPAVAAPPYQAPEWPRVEPDPRGVRLTFPQVAEVLIDELDQRVFCTPYENVDAQTVQRFVLDHVIPRLLSRRHALVLHASAVNAAGRALAFSGESGRGKSTLALSFALSGCPLIADDALVLDACAEGALARPLWPNLRLKRDMLPSGLTGEPTVSWNKALLGPGTHPDLSFASEPAPLAALYLLAPSSPTISIEPVRKRDAVVQLLRQCFHLELDDLEGLSRLMQRFEELGVLDRTFALSYPRDRSALDRLRSAVLDHATTVR